MKGKVSAYAGPIEKVFSPVHVTLSFTNKKDVTNDVIDDKVLRVVMTIVFCSMFSDCVEFMIYDWLDLSKKSSFLL